MHAAGAKVTLITGPVALPDPAGVITRHVETARDMAQACKEALPADIAVCAAAVSDWAVTNPPETKIKKENGSIPLEGLEFHLNPDILSELSTEGPGRPGIVVGFAAETENLQENGTQKLTRKNCDVICVNDVSKGQVFGKTTNKILCLSREKDKEIQSQNWDLDTKAALAQKLVNFIVTRIKKADQII